MSETIQHVFETCKKIQPQQNALNILKYEKYHKDVSVEVCNVLFSVHPLNGELTNSNLVILHVYTKQYIYIFMFKINKDADIYRTLTLFKSKTQD